MSNQANAQKEYGVFLGKLGQLKTRFNSQKGQADGLIIDGMSSVFETIAQEVQKLYMSIDEKDAKIVDLLKEIDGLKPKKIKESEVVKN